MNLTNNKCRKKTTYSQFQNLVELMEEFPQLATGNPSFGSNKAFVEQTWDSVAEKVNALRPPIRNGQEWKKIWHDQKFRLKKKICGNNKSLHGTGGGPCTVSSLTELECNIDRICHLSSAAAPSGKILGMPTAKMETRFPLVQSVNILSLPSITLPRPSAKVAVVIPTNSKGTQIHNFQYEDLTEIFTPNVSNIITLQNSPPKPKHQSSKQKKTSSTPKHTQRKRRLSQDVTRPFQLNKKRKHSERDSDREKILRQQKEIQQKTLDIMNKQLEAFTKSAEAAKIQAEGAKIQAEASKVQAEASKVQAEASKLQAESLKDIADSAKVMAQALVDLMKHLKDDAL